MLLRRLLIDAANVIGTRPDGWWRDRPAALARLRDRLSGLVAATGDEVVLVLDGPAPADPRASPGVVVVGSGRGRGAGDDALVAVLAADPDPGSVTVVTADRELRARVVALGAAVLGPRALLAELDAVPRLAPPEAVTRPGGLAAGVGTREEPALDLDEHARANQANWDERVAMHLASVEYGVEDFVRDRRVSDVVARDAPRIGDVGGRRLLHLQCHFGRDTLSWAVLGAEVTGLDFSGEAIAAARELSTRSGVPGRFVHAAVDDAVAALDSERFDVVYSGTGALNWLPDVARWARVVAALLAPGGTLFLTEGHPMLWAVDDERTDDLLALRYPYFETTAPLAWDDATSYAGEGEITNRRTYEWNHGLGEIVQAVLDAGLRVTGLREHREVPWKARPTMVTDDGAWWRLPDAAATLLPCSYTLTAQAPPA